jgi:lipoprotein-releasing system permease protein
LNFPFYIAKRYLFSKSSNNTINIITRIATIGVIVGTLALFIVLSGFSGLRSFSLGFLDTSDPDIKITSVKGKTFEFTDEIRRFIEAEGEITAYSKVVEERAFFEYKFKTHIAYIKGVDINYTNVNKTDTTVYLGNWLNSKIPSGVVVGNGIANILSVGVFDLVEPLKIYVPKPGKGYVTNPKKAFNQIPTQPIGVFALTEEIDKKFAFTHLALAQELLGYSENQISAIELKVKNLNNREIVITSLKENLGSSFKIQTREQLNEVFYKMLNTENFASYLIFTLIVTIALFNVVGAIIMMILDKRKNLKTLFNLGAGINEIKRIFILQGFLLTCFGLLIGLFIGIILILLQLKFQLFMITPQLAYPVELTFINVVTVIVTILFLGYLASLIASSRISKKLVE